MVKTLRGSYGLHKWYEHMLDGRGGFMLRETGDHEIVIKDKSLTFERDRPKVLFLERQSHLLG